MSATPIGPYTPVLKAGDWLIVSGQIGIDGDAKLVAGGMAAELRQLLANLSAHLQGAGASMDKVAKTTVFMTDMDDYPTMNEIYVAAFGDHRPARSAVAVAGLPLGASIEVEAWAHIG